jgi:hypothetical protein
MGESTTAATTTLRLVVYQGEVCRLPANSRAITVREGVAWMTSGGSPSSVPATAHSSSAKVGARHRHQRPPRHRSHRRRTPRSPSISTAARGQNACVSAGA